MAAQSVGSPAIHPDVVREHIQRATELMIGEDADGLILFRDTNILAFCGVPLAPSDRLICGILNKAGRLGFIVPALEAGMASGLPDGTLLRVWEEHEDPYLAAADIASQLGLARGSIRMDRHMWIEAQARFIEALPQAGFSPDTGIIEAVRLCKSPLEREAIRSTCREMTQAYRYLAGQVRAGVSEKELAAALQERIQGNGLAITCGLIQGGETASVPHRPAGARLLREGDAVLADVVCRKGSYHGDITRMFAVGGPAPDIKQAYGVVRQAQRLAIETIRPGVSCESVDRAARAVIEKAGLGEFFIHRLGHGIGLDGHEPPYLVRGNQRVLEPGMCMTVEPGVYIPDRFGIRIEDVVAVTETGCEILSDTLPTEVTEAFDAS